MRRATQATLAACATMRGEMLRDYRGQTQKFLSSLVRETSAQRRAATRHVMKIARDRQEIASQLRDRLQHDSRSLAEQTRAHQKMARQRKSSLEAGRRELGADVASFRGAIQRDLHPKLALLCTGPWPPYSFVSAEAGGRPNGEDNHGYLH